MDPEKLRYLIEKSDRLPLTPGVYIMKNKSGQIIYIGKAKALKRRVSQYFRRIGTHTEKVRQMAEHVDDFDYILTDSEFEALVLECSLIKQHRPKYNILLKDDKGYSYIRITLNEAWPRIMAVKKQLEDDATYFGPYMSSFSVKQAVDEARKAFLLPVCARRFPQDIGKGRPCLNYFIKQCCAPCRGKLTAAEYGETVDNAVTFLKGGYAPVFAKLEDEMSKAAEKLEFEKAARIRDRISAIRKISERQKVVESKIEEQDCIAVAGDGERTVFEAFMIRGGRLTDKKDFVVDYIDDEKQARAEFLKMFYSISRDVPAQITLDGETEDLRLIEEYLSKLRGKKTLLSVPKKGSQQKLAEMVRANADEYLLQLTARPAKEGRALDELKILLGLRERPKYIEAYDISHISGAGMVAGMVVFENGSPKKSRYKKFAIKTLDGVDDCAAMREAVGRRLSYLSGRESEKNDPGFLQKPDLILLDGGKAQVSAVQPLVAELGLDIPVFGMVKDGSHRTRAITADGGEIAIQSNRNVFTMVSKIQDEVHRFAISYHHKKRTAGALSTKLCEAPAIGPGRAAGLIRHFKSLSAVKAASLEELAAVKGMTAPAAKALRQWLDTIAED